jgi:hypothetical protein
MSSDKQAVLLIHGIGFQRPMRTLRGFAERVWVEDDSLRRPKVPSAVWSKPDTVSRSFELRRLTTARNKQDIRTDFFEFYWAHLMRGTTLGEVWQWMRTLLLRWPNRIPRPLVFPYWLLWIALIVALAASLNTALDPADRFWAISPVASAVASLILLPAVAWLLREIVGDAAVYLDAAPTNIQRRHEIRSAGVALLKTLHERGYRRIVLVGHSLGSVIGYDILKYAWAEWHDQFDLNQPQQCRALEEVEAAAQQLKGQGLGNLQHFHEAQRAYLAELQASGHPWRVTDFITLGSPLTYAELLLATDRADLERQIENRELPTCPPVMEPHFWFERKYETKSGIAERRAPHHAALFAATVWTNLFFPVKFLLGGDFIGGPLQTQFGDGILDVRVKTNIWSGLLSHTHYWSSSAAGTDTHLTALRKALNLCSA